jgi:hypothetical protein
MHECSDSYSGCLSLIMHATTAKLGLQCSYACASSDTLLLYQRLCQLRLLHISHNKHKAHTLRLTAYCGIVPSGSAAAVAGTCVATSESLLAPGTCTAVLHTCRHTGQCLSVQKLRNLATAMYLRRGQP